MNMENINNSISNSFHGNIAKNHKKPQNFRNICNNLYKVLQPKTNKKPYFDLYFDL